MDEFKELAQQQIERVKILCTHSGLKYVDLVPSAMGVGIAIGFGETDYVVVSVGAGGNENQLMITSGVLNDINRDRNMALEAANYFTSNNTAYPVYLHDAEVGWALLMQQTIPFQLALDVPPFFVNFCVKGLPQIVAEYRQVVTEKWRLGGRPWHWNTEDHNALLLRSMV